MYGLPGIDNGRVVMDPGDGPGLVGDGHAGREAGGNRVVELLPFEDRDHLGVGLRVDSTAVRQLVEEDEEPTRGRRVVEALCRTPSGPRRPAARACRPRRAPKPSVGSCRRRASRSSRLDAKLLLAVIIASQSSRSVSVLPTAA